MHNMQGEFALHWPLINSNHMRMRLAKRELEQKRVEDANRWATRFGGGVALSGKGE